MIALIFTVLLCSSVASENATTTATLTKSAGKTTSAASSTNVGRSTTSIPSARWVAESTQVEDKVEAGNEVTFDCGSYEAFHGVSLKWKKGEDEIKQSSDNRYTVKGEVNATVMLGRYLTIKDVTYSDRATFNCLVNYQNQTITNGFTLRVRDPLGSLWPLLGMILETIILFLVIVSCNYFKKKNSPKKFEQDTLLKQE